MADTQLVGVRVLVVSNEQVGVRMAGPAIRASHLAQQLSARGATVTLATPRPIEQFDAAAAGYANEAFGFPRPGRFRELARAHDVVVTQPQRVDVTWALHRSGTPIIFDLYVPSFVERIAQLAAEPIDERLKTRLLRRDQLEYAAAIGAGAAFICASDRQRDHWLGALGQAGRLDRGLLARDSAGDGIVELVPFGMPDTPPPALTAGEGAMRGSLVPNDAVVLLWTGGIWNWFDPVTVVEAFAQARLIEPRLRLVVLGLQHPEGAWDEQAAGAALRRRAEELGVIDDGTLVLREGWVPYEERHHYLLDADIAVSAHHDSLETRFSFRTRFLDHLWAGLPTISTAGGELTDRMAQAGAALTVGTGDVTAWRDAMLELAGDQSRRDDMSVAARTLGDAYGWRRVTQPLARLVSQVSGAAAPSDELPVTLRRRDVIRSMWLLVRIRIQAKGVRSLSRVFRR